MTSEYEYKAPSYRLHEPRMSPEDLSAAPARFSFSDGRWVPVSSLPGARPGRARVLIAGDLLCQEGMTEAFRTKAGRFDFSLCFEAVRPVLQAADLVIGNLETPVDECAPYRGEILTHEGPFFCNGPLIVLRTYVLVSSNRVPPTVAAFSRGWEARRPSPRHRTRSRCRTPSRRRP